MAKKKKKKKKYIGFRIFITLQIILILLVVGGIGYYYVGGYASTVASLRSDALEKVRSSSEEAFRENETSLVYDANGKVISTLVGDKDMYYLEYGDIPDYVFWAFISTEDKRFYKHGAVDLLAIVRAGWAAVTNGEITQGGSTLTQQLAKNVFLTQDRTWQRKAEEIFISIELEKIYTKDKILEFYVNNAYFANGNYGIEAAAKGYFDKSVSELSLSQIAFLCAIPNNPTVYDPLTNFDNTMTRRDRVLSAMLDEGYISAVDYGKAATEEIEIDRPKTVKHDYMETYTYHCAIRALMENDGFEFRDSFDDEEDEEIYNNSYNEVYSEYQKKLYTKGYRIYTSLDTSMQKKLLKSLSDGLSENSEKTKDGVYKLQGSAVCIDNITGYVTAIVGGRKQDLAGYTLNRAYQSFRQPGSSIKPLIVYTPILEQGYTPDSVVEDKKIEDGPSNSDGSYLGKISLRDAVAYSRNTVAWQLFDELTPEVGLSYLLEMGFSHIDDEDYRLTSAVGGLTEGVSALEMASAYSAIANDGGFREPTCIVKICTSGGDTILETSMEEKPVYEANASRMMTSMLESVMDYGTGKSIALDGYDCAGKTGTTNDNKDGWFVGYTYYYTTAVWVGYDKPKTLTGLQGASYPGQIWQDFMQKIHEDKENIEFKDYISYHVEDEDDYPDIQWEEDYVEEDGDQEDNVTKPPQDDEGQVTKPSESGDR